MKIDVETELINELAENGTDRARELFLQWQNERIKAKERFIQEISMVIPARDSKCKKCGTIFDYINNNPVCPICD